jgi:hypothetical protein
MTSAMGSTTSDAGRAGRSLIRQWLVSLKTVLQPEDAHVELAMDPVLAHLQSKLSAENHELLTALIAALSDSAKLAELDPFSAWREAKLEPQD